ncbi:hypothetical protein QPK87_30250 [Kamptonema cortianum]|nr:hypothetical protein [Kamptonema cortianum]
MNESQVKKLVKEYVEKYGHERILNNKKYYDISHEDFDKLYLLLNIYLDVPKQGYNIIKVNQNSMLTPGDPIGMRTGSPYFDLNWYEGFFKMYEKRNLDLCLPR